MLYLKQHKYMNVWFYRPAALNLWVTILWSWMALSWGYISDILTYQISILLFIKIILWLQVTITWRIVLKGCGIRQIENHGYRPKKALMVSGVQQKLGRTPFHCGSWDEFISLLTHPFHCHSSISRGCQPKVFSPLSMNTWERLLTFRGPSVLCPAFFTSLMWAAQALLSHWLSLGSAVYSLWRKILLSFPMLQFWEQQMV